VDRPEKSDAVARPVEEKIAEIENFVFSTHLNVNIRRNTLNLHSIDVEFNSTSNDIPAQAIK